MNRLTYALVLICFALTGTPSMAGSINPNDAPAVYEALGLAAEEESELSAPLFDFSPFSANHQRVVPGFADPLGTGVDPDLRVFNGRVHFMDLLGDFKSTEPDQTVEIEMPRGTLRASDLLSTLLSRYLEKGRAFDQSLLNIQDTEVRERNGLPVTTETSPLSLAGFGTVGESQKPFFLHWTACSARDKRRESMVNDLDKGRRACTAPGVCLCSAI